MSYHVIYDGNCNLCVTFTRLLEKFDRGVLFDYIPMQDETNLEKLGITSQDCEMGMILLDGNNLSRRWQGSDAAEEISRLLPMGKVFIDVYCSLPGMKAVGDHLYTEIRDNRYRWFGARTSTYQPTYSISCKIGDDCQNS
jgi:predicted DCC family thiol-disulfide oxidoreductase YuxK